MGAALLGGMPVAASVPPALRDEKAARTRLASLVSGGITLLVVLVPAPLRSLPVAVLSANLIRHASALIDARALPRLYRSSRREFLTALLAFVGVLVMGPMWGLAIGIVSNLFGALSRLALTPAPGRGSRPARDRTGGGR